jgi:hypothetical protein
MEPIQLRFEVRIIVAQFHDRDHGTEVLSEFGIARVRREPPKEVVLMASRFLIANSPSRVSKQNGLSGGSEAA